MGIKIELTGDDAIRWARMIARSEQIDRQFHTLMSEDGVPDIGQPVDRSQPAGIEDEILLHDLSEPSPPKPKVVPDPEASDEGLTAVLEAPEYDGTDVSGGVPLDGSSAAPIKVAEPRKQRGAARKPPAPANTLPGNCVKCASAATGIIQVGSDESPMVGWYCTMHMRALHATSPKCKDFVATKGSEIEAGIAKAKAENSKPKTTLSAPPEVPSTPEPVEADEVPVEAVDDFSQFLCDSTPEQKVELRHELGNTLTLLIPADSAAVREIVKKFRFNSVPEISDEDVPKVLEQAQAALTAAQG